MQLITILNSVLLSSLVAILVCGIILNIKYVEPNSYRKNLLSMLTFWAVTMIFVLAKFYTDGLNQISYNSGTLNMQVLLLGIPCFFMLVSYPVMILNSSFLRFKSWSKLALPPLSLFAIYFVWHAVKGINPFEVYPSVRYVVENITSMSVLLRVLLVVIFIIYVVRYIIAIYMVVPYYDRYVRDNIADSTCNVDWVRPLLVRVAVTTSLYFIMLIFSSPYVNFFYISSVISIFVYLIDASLFRNSSSRVERLVVRRVPGAMFKYVVEDDRGVVVEAEEDAPHHCECDFKQLAKQLDGWMVAESPYSNIDFTTSDILNKFPNITSYDLRAFFALIGESFQTYVRRYRIVKACQMIIQSDNRVYSKEIFGSVGFSHHSSFSRSFVALVGVSPTEYAKLSKEEQQSIEVFLAKGLAPLVNQN